MSKLINVVEELESLLPFLKGSTQGAAVEFAIRVLKEQAQKPAANAATEQVPSYIAVAARLRQQLEREQEGKR